MRVALDVAFSQARVDPAVRQRRGGRGDRRVDVGQRRQGYAFASVVAATARGRHEGEHDDGENQGPAKHAFQCGRPAQPLLFALALGSSSW